MIESLASLFVVVVAIASLAAYIAVWDSLFDRRVRTTLDIARRVPLRAFVAGAINLAFFGILTVFLIRAASGGAVVRSAPSTSRACSGRFRSINSAARRNCAVA